MNNRRERTATGILLVAIGVLALMAQLGLGELFGQVFVAGIGLIFLLIHFVGKVDWALYPGAFITTVGTVIFLAARNVNMEVFWPLFVVAPGVSFFIIRLSSPSNRWAVYPGFIVTGVGLVMFAFSTGLVSWLYLEVAGKIWPAALIIVGLLLIVKSWKSGDTAQR